MNTGRLFDPDRRSKVPLVFIFMAIKTTSLFVIRFFNVSFLIKLAALLRWLNFSDQRRGRSLPALRSLKGEGGNL